MKKGLIGILVAVLVFGSAATSSLAKGMRMKQNCTGTDCQKTCEYNCPDHQFTDEDEDGICDYRNATATKRNCFGNARRQNCLTEENSTTTKTFTQSGCGYYHCGECNK